MGPEHLTDIAIMVRFGVLLILYVLAYMYLITPTTTEEFRQDLFRIRREIFMLVAEGRLSVDEPAYRTITSSINAMLRYAEHVTFGRLIIGLALHRSMGAPGPAVVEEIRAVGNQPVRSRLFSLYGEFGGAIMRHVMRASIGGRLIYLIGTVVGTTRQWMKMLSRRAEHEALTQCAP